MKNLFLICIVSLFGFSCKKDYSCKCYSDRRGYIIEEYTHSYKEKKKETALSKCKNDYESTGNYVEGYSCEIK